MRPKKHGKSPTSKMSRILAPYFDSLPPDEFSSKSCPSKGNCSLAPGIEHLFVFQTAFAAFERLKGKMKNIVPCQVIYMPHTRSEKGGFDLSLGTVESERRILLMHKLRKSAWCDSRWCWKSSSDSKAHGQIIKLLDHYAMMHDRLPFLGLHTCYCVHEYRRMGSQVKGLQVPGFCHRIRSVFLDLLPILQVDDWRGALRRRQVHVEVKHQPSDGSVRSAVVSSGDGKEVAVLGAAELSAFLDAVEKHLAT
jgi:hypothetical protein